MLQALSQQYIIGSTEYTKMNCDNNNHQTTQSIADYLAQLLKDRKQLAAFPNVFNHVERLLDEGWLNWNWWNHCTKFFTSQKSDLNMKSSWTSKWKISHTETLFSFSWNGWKSLKHLYDILSCSLISVRVIRITHAQYHVISWILLP